MANIYENGQWTNNLEKVDFYYCSVCNSERSESHYHFVDLEYLKKEGEHPRLVPKNVVQPYGTSHFDPELDKIIDNVNKIIDKHLDKPHTINETIEERTKLYGDFKDHAQITQDLKMVMRNFKNGAGWDNLSPTMAEALDMIVHKIGRILNGDPTYADSWHDIAGYATLVEQRLNNK